MITINKMMKNRIDDVTIPAKGIPHLIPLYVIKYAVNLNAKIVKMKWERKLIEVTSSNFNFISSPIAFLPNII